jgi:hypothetical protein
MLGDDVRRALGRHTIAQPRIEVIESGRITDAVKSQVKATLFEVDRKIVANSSELLESRLDRFGKLLTNRLTLAPGQGVEGQREAEDHAGKQREGQSEAALCAAIKPCLAYDRLEQPARGGFEDHLIARARGPGPNRLETMKMVTIDRNTVPLFGRSRNIAEFAKPGRKVGTKIGKGKGRWIAPPALSFSAVAAIRCDPGSG